MLLDAQDLHAIELERKDREIANAREKIERSQMREKTLNMIANEQGADSELDPSLPPVR